ncbi:MAG: ribbon-helix-helix protein, CopG family [Oligoflexia bacterium]|nr:ribbon-helix-helix protein, CopG family [Oligoflexia bacterium]
MPVSVRLSKRAAEQLKRLATHHNMSQADVIENLLAQEYEQFEKSLKNLKAADSANTHHK